MVTKGNEVKFLKFLIVFILPLSDSGLLHSQPSTPDDSLQNVTATRPVDLVDRHQWNISSPDFFTYWLENGLYGYFGPQPQILIDGLPVNANFFGWQNLNMLPIYLPSTEAALTKPDPGYAYSMFHSTGYINFSSSKPDTGWAVSSSLFWGNETGDPGPWIYDSSRVTPNVDRWGPDAGGTISYNGNNWFAKGVAIVRKHQQTDPISHRRLHNTVRSFGATRFYPIQTTSASGLLESGYRSGKWQIRGRGILASDENYLFLQAFGREVPVRTEYSQFAITSAYSPGNWRFNMRFIHDEKKLRRRNEEHDYIFNWSEKDNGLSVEASYKNEIWDVNGGLTLKDKRVTAPGIAQQNHNLQSFFTVIRLATGSRSQLLVSSNIDLYDKKTAEAAKVSYGLQLIKNWRIQSTAHFSEVLPILQQSFGYWIGRGYNFFEELGISISRPLNITNNRLAGFTIQNNIQLTRSLSLDISQEFRHHFELNIPWQTVIYSDRFDSQPGTFEITQESGSRFLFGAALTHSARNKFYQKLSIHFQESLDGSQRYTDYFRQISSEKLVYELNISPVRNLELSLQGIYQSSSVWNEFDALDGEQYRDVNNLFPVFTGTFASTVPAHFNIDAGAKKWLWERRLSLQLSVKNLLNDEIRMHPMGAGRSFTFNLKAVATF